VSQLGHRIHNGKSSGLSASGGIGQPLSLLLKLNHTVTVNTPSVAADLGHINTPAVVNGYLPDNNGLVTGSHIIVIPAGLPRKPGMTRDDLFKI
ncbi:3116_t:CDS:2, partial [Paraglomus brasilianum]